MKKVFRCFLIMIPFCVFAEEGLNEPLRTRCARIKLKTGAMEETRDWFNTMMSQKEEVLEILKEQGVYVEAVFLDRVGEDDYLIYFMKEESSEKSLVVSSQSKHPINEKHREYKRNCWEEKVLLEPLLDLDRIRLVQNQLLNEK